MDKDKEKRQKLKCYMAPDMCHRGDVIKNRWEVVDKLGAGTFGQVYKVFDLRTGLYWAMKVEAKTARKPVLRMDVAISRALMEKKHAAEFFACGHEPNFSYMVSQLLGRNLASRKRTTPDGRFPLRTVIRIGVQALQGLRDMHECGYLHRDLKPSNMATGVDEYDKVVYLIDFGLARKFLDDKGRIYPPRAKANFRGTVRYAAPRAHVNQELSRGDDLWSLFYTLVDLAVGHLPWHNVRDMKRVGEAKVFTRYEELCRGFPTSWRLFHAVCKQLQYDSVPDYDFLIQAVNGVTSTKPRGVVDLKQLTTAPWEWEAPPGDTSTESFQ